MRGQRVTTPPPPSERDATTRALGAGLGLLGTFVGAIAFAFVMSRLVGGMYVTFVMPLFVGMLLAAFAAMGPKRFRFGDRKALIAMMIAGALVCWIGHHLLAYLRVIDITAGAVGAATAEEAAAALRTIENHTRQEGVLAYLSYVSSGPGAVYSPIGMAGRLEPGVVGTLLIMVTELALMAGTASWSLLYRTRHLRREAPGPIAWFDAQAAVAAGEKLLERRFDELATIVASSPGTSHVLIIELGESAAEVAIFECDAAGQPTTRKTTRLLPFGAAEYLRNAVARAARPGGPDGADNP